MMNLSCLLVITTATIWASTIHLSKAGAEACPTNCLNDKCSSTTKCTDGCKNSYYGDSCSYSCNTQCINSTCHVSVETGSAVCTVGCKDGYKGNNCELRCPRHCTACNTTTCRECEHPWWYGQMCGEYCSHCKEHLCHRNGTCIFECSGFAKGPGCNCDHGVCASCDNKKCASCPRGRYGGNCSRSCSTGCLNKVCNMHNGSCSDGCIAGRGGNNCTDVLLLAADGDTTQSTRRSVHTGTSEESTTEEPLINEDTYDDMDDLKFIVIVTVSVTCVLVLLSFCLITSICPRGKNRNNSHGNSHDSSVREDISSEGLYEEIRDCDVTSVVTDNGRREVDSAGYITPRDTTTQSRSSRAFTTHHQHRNAIIFENPRDISHHTNQCFTESNADRMPGSDVPPAMCRGPRRTWSTLACRDLRHASSSICPGHLVVIWENRAKCVPRHVWRVDNCHIDTVSTSKRMVSPWQNSPELRSKFTLNTNCERLLSLMPEDSSSEEETSHISVQNCRWNCSSHTNV